MESSTAADLVRSAESGVPRGSVDQVLATIPTGIYFLDHGWRFTYVNPEAERLVRRSATDLVGRRLWDAFPAAANSIIEEHYRRAVATGQPVSFETYYPEPLDGWYEVRATPGPDGLSVYFLEVTERHRAQRQAGRVGRHLALLARISRDLAESVTTGVVPAGLPGMLTPELADGCVISVVAADGAARTAAAWHGDPATATTLRSLAAAMAESPVWDADAEKSLALGCAVRLTGSEAQRRLASRRARELLSALSPTDVLLLPVRHQSLALGRLVLCYTRGRRPTAEETATLEDVASRLGLALDNARLYFQQRHMAAELQRSLLTAAPQPSDAPYEVAVRYLPAAETAAVGGDWYDLLRPDDGSTVLVIGDVAGHDVTAAATMGQLRGLLRGIIMSRNDGPADVLCTLDRAMDRLGMPTLATALVARLDPVPGQRALGRTRLEWSSGGHPPAAVVTAGGTVSLLDSGRADVLLGVVPDRTRKESTALLPGGSTVVLYSDGLIEQRHADLDAGLHRLRRALSQFAHRTLAELCDGLLETMVGSRPDDDVALVAVRLPGRSGESARLPARAECGSSTPHGRRPVAESAAREVTTPTLPALDA